MGENEGTIKDVARVLKVSRATAHAYTKLESFPKPKATVVGIRVWDLGRVKEWGELILPLPVGRPPKKSPEQERAKK